VKVLLARQKTQYQMFYEEQRKIADADHLFMELVRDGLTRAELQAAINRRPALWERYENWLPVLPETR
jgi:hypothetical protein